jgi:hypothetical protein
VGDATRDVERVVDTIELEKGDWDIKMKNDSEDAPACETGL